MEEGKKKLLRLSLVTICNTRTQHRLGNNLGWVILGTLPFRSLFQW
jgi:hypothetical protein